MNPRRAASEGVHATAVIDPDAVVPESASVGPFCVIGPGVELGARVVVGPHVTIERNVRLGSDCVVGAGAVLGTDPQDLKYRGEESWLHIGDRTVIREYATLNRATAATGSTDVGSDCLIMAYAHVAHDCRIGNHVILANAVNMGGHVQIEDWAVVGGLVAVHQFVRIGAHGMVGGASRLSQDVAPFTLVAGNPCRAHGLNRVGLERRGFSAEAVRALRSAYRTLFRSDLNLGDAIAQLEAGAPPNEVRRMIEFIRRSERGITT